ncbi:hypothetical protein DUNSADRAFT_14913 [Dunaliella salina]|uniref:Uncharacterized protein n=1 Tax=Dunaliella salina TaxID=3046 RepID=A0ABQ7G6F2_DUNSA|nr:hypothetical protein DUNSADRAFT_14913 [Dunaliella salina]|eukprot:KAF5830183.1 hypothetical protein DUNSADRAFT_14913 [Dunaliella salina]
MPSLEATPRVNFEAMQRFQGRKVLLTGEVKSLSDGKVLMRTSDDAEVLVICNPNFSGSFDSAFVEVRQGVLGKTNETKGSLLISPSA